MLFVIELKTMSMKYGILCAFFMVVACRATSQEVVPDDKGKDPKKNEEMKDPEADCNMDLEDDVESGLIYHTKSGLPFTGVCRSYYEDGNKEREVHFRDGLIDGMAIALYKYDQEKNQQIIESRINHKMGVPDGKWEFFYESGQRAWENYYVDGQKHGTFIWYAENGKKTKEESWKNNLKHGACKLYYEGEKPKEEINYKEGIMDGKFITWYDNGQTEYEGTFKDGKEEGEIVTFYKNSQMQTQRFFKNGIPDGEWKTWHDDGKEKSIEHYVKGVLEGECKEFYSDGQVKKIEVFVQGKLISSEQYDEFGNKLDPEELKKDEDE
ncbi:MAG: toxin-antitoxin system YwqK family antitoxin [Flavobacteriales bacterium]